MSYSEIILKAYRFMDQEVVKYYNKDKVIYADDSDFLEHFSFTANLPYLNDICEYISDEYDLDLDEADDKPASTTFRPRSAKDDKETASVPPAASIPWTSGVTSSVLQRSSPPPHQDSTTTTSRPRRCKDNRINVCEWLRHSDLSESASSWVNSGSSPDDEQ